MSRNLLSNKTSTDDEDKEAYAQSEVHLKTLAKMLESKCRFRYEDKGGRLHIIYTGRCDCTEILCDHGWSPRFILQIIVREGQTVGADINLSELFISHAEQSNAGNSQQTTPLSAFVDKTKSFSPTPAVNTFMQSANEVINMYGQSRKKSVPERQPSYQPEP